MSGGRADAVRLNDILQSVTRLEELLRIGFETFAASRKDQSAAIRELEVIGEAAGHLSSVTRARYPDVEWARMRGFSSFAKHEYWRVNPVLVWKAIGEMPSLRRKLDRVLPPRR